MSGDAANPGPPRIWCTAAAEAPIVAVIARFGGKPRWTCILRWNWKTGTVDEGSWTRLDVLGHRCALSRDGEYFLYYAKGGSLGPFSPRSGGAATISRLPWLTALTDAENHLPAGGGPTRDALEKDQQERLWRLFDPWPIYIRDEDWPAPLGTDWKRVANLDALRAHFGAGRRLRIAATASIPRSSLSLLAVVTTRGAQYSVFGHEIRFHLARGDDAMPQTHLEGVRWARPTDDGRLLVATDAGSLEMRTIDAAAGSTAIAWQRDLSAMNPNPRSAPAWAIAPI